MTERIRWVRGRHIISAGAIFAVLLVSLFSDVNNGLIAKFAVTGVAVLSWVFVGLYSRSNWRATTVGRAVMYGKASLGALSTQVAISLWFGTNYPFRDEVRAVLYVCLVLTVWNLIMALRDQQRKSAGKPKFKWM